MHMEAVGLYCEGLILPDSHERDKKLPSEIKAGLFFQIFSPIWNVLVKIIRVITGYSFWAKKLKDPEEVIIFSKDLSIVDKVIEYTLEEKFANFGMDLLRIILSPLLALAALICFIYSLVDVKEGQHLFVNACELFKGNAISRWNRDVKHQGLDESLRIESNYLFPSRDRAQSEVSQEDDF